MILFKLAVTNPSMLCQEKLSVLMISMKVFTNMYHSKFTNNIIEIILEFALGVIIQFGNVLL